MILPAICTWLVIIIMAESQAAITAISRLQNQSNKPNLLLRGTDNCVKKANNSQGIACRGCVYEFIMLGLQW